MSKAIEQPEGKSEGFGTNPDHFYTLYYKINYSKPQDKTFYFPGTIQEAQARAQEHCKAMGYRFIVIRKFLANLDVQEQKKDHEEDAV